MLRLKFQCVVPGCPHEVSDRIHSGHNFMCSDHFPNYFSPDVRCAINGCEESPNKVITVGDNIYIPLCRYHGKNEKVLNELTDFCGYILEFKKKK